MMEGAPALEGAAVVLLVLLSLESMASYLDKFQEIFAIALEYYLITRKKSRFRVGTRGPPP
jgi:hypothetical protein